MLPQVMYDLQDMNAHIYTVYLAWGKEERPELRLQNYTLFGYISTNK